MPPTPSSFGTINVPAVPAQAVGPFYAAPADTAMRVLLRNIGGAAIYVAFDSAALNGTNITAAHYELPAGATDVFVIQPRQSIFAVASGGGRLCYAASEALPIKEL